MTDYMTIDQIVTASRNDVTRQIAKGTMRKESEQCPDDCENIYTIISLYTQWAENETEAEEAVRRMFEEEFPEYL